ncbi:MAG: sporulation transcription factor Spo0A [Firmicutes bacterium]|nr:sporulation transcription factor Spo0A [Bacillota bacterium]
MKTSIKVLVVDNNDSMTKDMMKYFSSHEVIEVVACKKDGEEGLSYILNNHSNIDVIIMDLIIPKLDGLFILSELEKRRINKNVIITTSFKDDRIMDDANQYGIDYYMLKPINFMSLEKRILSINMRKKSGRLYSQEAIITDLLHNLGIPSHIRGYQYIKEGILIVYKSGNNISYITKDVYPEIAIKFNTTPTRVERAIRHAIEISWNRGDLNLMEEIFGNSLNVNRDKPTNAEYLTTIADRIKLNHNLVCN